MNACQTPGHPTDCEVQSDGRHVSGPRLQGRKDVERELKGPVFLLMGLLVAVGLVLAFIGVRNEEQDTGSAVSGASPDPSEAAGSPSPALLPVYAEELTPRQTRYYRERAAALVAYARAGDFDSLNELLLSDGLKNCEQEASGGTYEAASKEQLAIVAFAREEALSKADFEGWTVLLDRDLSIPPAVEPAYEGRYPNGEAVLDVIPRRGKLVFYVRCLEEA